MTIDPIEAAASLSDVASVERRTREALNYGFSSAILMVWGLIWAIGYLLTYLQPTKAALVWDVLSAVGVVAAVACGIVWSKSRRENWDWRITAAFIVMIGFGFFWQWLLGGSQWRELPVFWSTLFMFGYIVAGLWMGRFFIVCGIVVTGLVLAGYLWTGPWFLLWMAGVGGGSLILGGLWLRRLGAR